MPLPHFQSMPLGSLREPFSDPDWPFEIKWDGFRSLVQVEDGEGRLVSRNGNAFRSFPALNHAILHELRARSAVLDGEIVCLDRNGKPQFRDLFFRHGEPRFMAFDLLWADSEDLRHLPLIKRKIRLQSVIVLGFEPLRQSPQTLLLQFLHDALQFVNKNLRCRRLP